MPVSMVKQAVKPKSSSAKTFSATSTDSGDVISQIVQKVETGSKDKTHARIKELTAVEGGLSNFELGGLLSLVREGGTGWLAGHASFDAYCREECGFSGLKGWHLTKIYKLLAVNKVPWDEVKVIRWWKLSLIARAKIEQKDLAKWLAKAKTLNAEQLENELKGGKATTKPGPLTINVHHEDQKQTIRAALDKAKEESNTKYDAVALHNMSQAYLGNSVTMDFKCPHCGKCATSGADSG